MDVASMCNDDVGGGPGGRSFESAVPALSPRQDLLPTPDDNGYVRQSHPSADSIASDVSVVGGKELRMASVAPGAAEDKAQPPCPSILTPTSSYPRHDMFDQNKCESQEFPRTSSINALLDGEYKHTRQFTFDNLVIDKPTPAGNSQATTTPVVRALLSLRHPRIPSSAPLPSSVTPGLHTDLAKPPTPHPLLADQPNVMAPTASVSVDSYFPPMEDYSRLPPSQYPCPNNAEQTADQVIAQAASSCSTIAAFLQTTQRFYDVTAWGAAAAEAAALHSILRDHHASLLSSQSVLAPPSLPHFTMLSMPLMPSMPSLPPQCATPILQLPPQVAAASPYFAPPHHSHTGSQQPSRMNMVLMGPNGMPILDPSTAGAFFLHIPSHTTPPQQTSSNPTSAPAARQGDPGLVFMPQSASKRSAMNHDAFSQFALESSSTPVTPHPPAALPAPPLASASVNPPELTRDGSENSLNDQTDSLDMEMDAQRYRKRNRTAPPPPGRCHSCNISHTPEWRRGPDGARTLCNACGLHYAKMQKKLSQQRQQRFASNASSAASPSARQKPTATMIANIISGRAASMDMDASG